MDCRALLFVYGLTIAIPSCDTAAQSVLSYQANSRHLFTIEKYPSDDGQACLRFVDVLDGSRRTEFFLCRITGSIKMDKLSFKEIEQGIFALVHSSKPEYVLFWAKPNNDGIIESSSFRTDPDSINTIKRLEQSGWKFTDVEYYFVFILK